MTEVFHHGTRVLQQDTVYTPIQTTDTSTIGLLYTAPNADPDLYPLNTPKLFLADRFAAANLGSAGTGLDALNRIWNYIGVPVVGVRVDPGQTSDQALANMVGTYAARSGANAFYSAKNSVFKVPKILIAPGFTHQRVTGGITQVQGGLGGAGYTYANLTVNGNGQGGGFRAIGVISQGVITGWQIVNCGIGYQNTLTPASFTIQGDGAGATIAGYNLGAAANPVVAELAGIGNRLRSTVIADAPNGTAEQSIAYRRDWATERVYVVDNWGLTEDPSGNIGSQPNSAAVAGLLAQVDNDQGFWVSPSNHVLTDVLGTSRPIDDSGVGGEADYLNQNDVATVLHRGGGIKLWGNHGCATDPLWEMFSVGRVRDALYDSLEAGIDAADDDKPLNLAFYEGVAEGVNEYIRYLRQPSIGALIGGRVWVDPALNPPSALVLGKPKFSMDFEPVGVAEDIQIIAARNPGYYADLVNQVVLALGS